MVSRPMVEYLLEHSFSVTLADQYIYKADRILNKHPKGKSAYLDANNENSVDQLVSNADLVVSLLPFSFHPMVMRSCLHHKKNMVTTSYMKPVMKEMAPKLKAAGIIMLNEIGVDPGIDHMSAKRIIDKIHVEGGEIIDFYSFCGALPSPEAINNPFNYRFTWSPKGVLMAGKNKATYKMNNEIKEVNSMDLFKDIRLIAFNGIGEMEVYPNRNSLEYGELYHIPEAETVFRGTIRYPGWCEIMDQMKRLNLFSEDKIDVTGKTYGQLMAGLIGEDSSDHIKSKLADYLSVSEHSQIISALEFAGFFTDLTIAADTQTLFDITSDLMINKMLLSKSEKDMVLLMHCFKYKSADGKLHHIRSTLQEFGNEKNTAVARTVALPAAIAVRMILEKRINLSGAFIPNIPEIYNPIMDELETWGIKMEEVFDLNEAGISEC